jgi:hypothetical protein
MHTDITQGLKKTLSKCELLSDIGGYVCFPNDNKGVGKEEDGCSAIRMIDQ